MPQDITFKRPDGASTPGHLAEADHPLGAVVVIQEWWGLNDQIRGVAQRLAAAGFTALVPDLYRGKSTVEAEEAEHLKSDLDFADAASVDQLVGFVRLARRTGRDTGVAGARGVVLRMIRLLGHEAELGAA